MKKLLALLLALGTMLALSACFADDAVDPNAKSDGSMTYAQYAAAKTDEAVVIEGFVQAKQSWWDDKATIYLQDGDGAYFVYEMTCSKQNYEKLTVGTKIKVTGYKTEWSGEVEIASGATFEILEGDTWVAEAKDVTSLLNNSDELIKHQNQLVTFNGMTVVKVEYKNGTPGDDIYVTLSKDGVEYSFCVEYYLTNEETAVYSAVGALKAGDTVDVEGFLYWYNGMNPHITKVTVK